MATYLPNVTDAPSALPLYNMDVNYIRNTLQRSNLMYEQGANTVRNAYNSILNAPLSNPENALVRDKYLQQSEDQLKELSQSDLSLPQNQQMAQKVFAPFWEDKDLVADYAKTRQVIAEQQRAESLLKSNDPKVREQFWQTGLDYVNLSAQQLQNTRRGDGSIQKVKVNSFVPYYNVDKYLQEEAKNEGLKIVRESANGPYKIIRENGDDTAPLYREWAMRKLANNPQVSDVFRVQGTVDYYNKLNSFQRLGLPEAVAKDMLAKDYINEQLSFYKSQVDDIEKAKADYKATLDAQITENKKKLQEGTLTEADMAKLTAMQGSYKQFDDSLTKNKEEVGKYSDPENKDYKDIYNSIIDNGEEFYSENRRNAFVNNFARYKALNSSTKYEIDPSYKLSTELQTEYMKLQQQMAMFNAKQESTNNTNNSGTRIGSSSTGKVNELDTPIPVGLNVKGKDEVSAFDRLVSNEKNLLDQYVNSGLSLINSRMSEIDPAYLDYIKQSLTTGKFTPSRELEQEHKRLQDRGIIPPNLSLGTAPSDVYNYLYNYTVKQLKADAGANKLDPSILSALVQREDAATKYYKLRDTRNKVVNIFKTDPVIGEIFNEQGNRISFEGFLAKQGLPESVDAYINTNLGKKTKRVAVDPGFSGAVDIIPLTKEELAKEYETMIGNVKAGYDKLYKKAENKVSNALKSYIDQEGAYIGPSVRLSTDRKEDQEQAQTIAYKVMSEENLAKQVVTKDGRLPVNISQLEEVGADREQLAKIIQATKSNVGNLIDGVVISKIGLRGKPTVKVLYNREEVRKYLGENDFKNIDSETLDAMSDGLEFEVEGSTVNEFNQEFVSQGADYLNMEKGVVKAPAVLSEITGFDYNIKRDQFGNQYIVNFTYVEPDKNGNLITKQAEPMRVPLQTSVSEIQNKINSRIIDMYRGNKINLENRNNSAIFGKNPNTLSGSWEDVAKAYNISI